MIMTLISKAVADRNTLLVVLFIPNGAYTRTVILFIRHHSLPVVIVLYCMRPDVLMDE